MKKIYTLLILALNFSLNSIAQCPSGQVNVTIDVTTDDWGYECFWDLTPTGNGCGNGALFTFGNTTEVNCSSGGTQVATAGGYGDNITTTEVLGCLTVGSCFDINYVDDYGDGGASFVVKYNGVVMQSFSSDMNTVSTTYTFCTSVPPAYDAEITTSGAKYTLLPLSQSLNFVAPATITSAGTATITGVKTKVKVTKAGVQLHTASSATQTLTTLTSGSFAVAPYTATSFGEHTVTYTSQIDEVDEVALNDTSEFSVDITDTIYAIDDGTSTDLIGLASGELGYLGNLFDINKATKASSVSVYLGDGTQVSGASAVDSVFNIRIFNTDAMGIPTTVLASTSGVIENVLEKWYTVAFTTPVTLNPGKYMIALEEEFYVQELGLSMVFNPATSYIYSLTLAPWSPVEDFGLPATFMIRLNLETSGLALSELSKTKLEIYPNPAHDNLNVVGTKVGSKIEIFNQLGQVVLTSVSNSENAIIDVQTLKKGMYSIKTISDNEIGVTTFIKN
jgi:hypothetical protein